MPPHSGLETQLNWLLNHSLQASMLVLLVLAVQWLFRRQLTNCWRFALWWVVLARLLLPFSPPSAVSLFNVVRPAVQIAGLGQVASAPITPDNDHAPVPILRRGNPIAENAVPVGQFPLPATPLLSLKPATVLAATQSPLSVHDFIIPGLAALWLAGVLILSGVVMAQLIRFHRKLARASAPCASGRRPWWQWSRCDHSAAQRSAGAAESAVGPNPGHGPGARAAELQALLDDCRREFGVSRPIKLLETDAVQSPALFGLRRLRLLLPRGLGGQFAESELRHIFLHEIAHVKRGDLWLNWLVTALQILHWFNPLLWFGFARLRADRELACDELALLRAGDNASTAYGETIVKLLENLSRPAAAIPGLVGILEDQKQMRRRISMIVNFRRPGRWSALAVILIAAIAATALTDAQNSKPDQPADARIKMENDVTDISGRNHTPTVGSYDPYFTPQNRMPDIAVTISTNSHVSPGLALNTAWGRKHTNSSEMTALKLADEFSVSVSPSPANVTYTITPPLKPIPGKQIGGVVLSPDGQPAADAQVTLQVEGYPIQLGRGQFKGIPSTGLATTAADGGFALPLYENARSLIALNREGFANVSLNPSDSSLQITLQKWGRIEGTLRTGDRLGTNEIVGLWPGGNSRPHPPMSSEPPLTPWYSFDAYQSRTDGQGRFAFSLVPPGWQDLCRETQADDSGWTLSQLSRVEVLPGETTVTNVTGRNVVGRLKFTGDRPKDLTTGIGFFIGTNPATGRFPVLDIGANGSFRAEYVLPGTYNFRFVQYRHRLPDENSYLSIEGRIGFSRQPFSVPEAKDPDDDSIVALGTIELE